MLPNAIQIQLRRRGFVGFYTNKMRYVKKHVLNVLARRKFSRMFVRMLHSSRYPNYRRAFRNPVDLSLIRYRLKGCYYSSVYPLLQDLNRLVNNNKQYFKYDAIKYHKCLKLEEFIFLALLEMPSGPERQVLRGRRVNMIELVL